MHGVGKLTFPDKHGGKAVYRGDFAANLFHGDGKLAWSNNDCYEGPFVNGQYEGMGDFKWNNTKYIYKGYFKKGLMHG